MLWIGSVLRIFRVSWSLVDSVLGNAYLNHQTFFYVLVIEYIQRCKEGSGNETSFGVNHTSNKWNGVL